MMSRVSKNATLRLPAKSATDFNALSKQIDDYAAQQKNIQKQILDLMDKYDIDAMPIDPEELEQLLKKYPDLKKLNDEYVVLQQKIQKIRYENPGLWTPGEDVANYYDVEALQKKLKDIADEDAAYISELERKRAELIRTSEGVSIHTDEVSNELNKLKDQRRALVDESLKSQGLSYDDIDNAGRDELNALEELLRSKDSELEALYQEMRQARSKDRETWNKAYDMYHDKLKQNPEYKSLDAKISSERKVLNKRHWEAKSLIEKENQEVDALNKQIDELDHIYSPEYEAYLNEQEYVNELLRDAKKTVGDKQNIAWWDAIPDDIKAKYVEYKDEQIIDLLAQDDELSWYVNNYYQIYENPEEMNKFYKALERKLNEFLPEKEGVSIHLYNDPESGIKGSMDIFGNYEINTAYDPYLEQKIGVTKHEVLGHRVDNVMPNDGLQGETMQRFISDNNDDGFSQISSHGNSDPVVDVAYSPITKTPFTISDASDDVKQALRDEGWEIKQTTDRDTYQRYRAEVTEQEAWSITPTTNVRSKVNDRRKALGLPNVSNTVK